MKVINYILFGILLVGLVFVAWKSYTIKEKVEYITVTDTVKICDTITNMAYDTVYFSHYDTINTTDVVIINDTVNDTTYIQLSIYTYIFDTIIQDSTYRTSLRAVTSGFQCQMDSLYLSTEIMKQEPKITPKKWYNNFGVGVGLMYGTGGAGVGVGLMYKLF